MPTHPHLIYCLPREHTPLMDRSSCETYYTEVFDILQYHWRSENTPLINQTADGNQPFDNLSLTPISSRFQVRDYIVKLSRLRTRNGRTHFSPGRSILRENTTARLSPVVRIIPPPRTPCWPPSRWKFAVSILTYVYQRLNISSERMDLINHARHCLGEMSELLNYKTRIT